jgi:DNA polymerase-3 subunit alpha
LDDRTARIEMTVFSDVFNKYRDLLNKDQLLVVEGEVSVDDYTGGYKIMSRKIFSIDQAREIYAKCLWLKMHDQQMENNFLDELKTISPFRGGKCPIYISYKGSDASTRIALGPEWNIKPRDNLLTELYSLCKRASCRWILIIASSCNGSVEVSFILNVLLLPVVSLQ